MSTRKGSVGPPPNLRPVARSNEAATVEGVVPASRYQCQGLPAGNRGHHFVIGAKRRCAGELYADLSRYIARVLHCIADDHVRHRLGREGIAAVETNQDLVMFREWFGG